MRRDPSDVHPSDENLKEAIHDAFVFDPRVLSMNPEIQVENGVVTLHGVAQNLRAKEAAEEDVRNTTGVVQVKSFISIRSLSTQNDREIAEEVRQAFLRDPYVEKFGIHVRVDAGRAILTGTVDMPFQKWHARRIASSVSGIKEIINHIRVDVTKTQKKDEELIWAIKDRLWWNPYIDSYQILVVGEDRTITLSGITDTWIERNLAEQIAYESGAKQVENHIRLRQSSDFEAES
jgi:osmotically-inducible protein OsmY